LFSGPGDRRLNEEDRINFSRPIQLREIMVKNGDANKPIQSASSSARDSHRRSKKAGAV
jgi:hypothetical protein